MRIGPTALAVVIGTGFSAKAQAQDAFGWGTTDPSSVPSATTTAPAAAPPPPAPPPIASSETPSVWKNFSFEVAARAGWVTTPIRGAISPFGAGFGGRVGIVFADVYLGATVIDYLGGSDDYVSDRSLFYGISAGYGFRVLLGGTVHFIARPELGIGGAAIAHTDPSTIKVDVVTSASGRTSKSSSGGTVTVNALYLEPAITLMLTSRVHFIDVSGSAIVLPNVAYGGDAEATTWRAFGLHADVGFRF